MCYSFPTLPQVVISTAPYWRGTDGEEVPQGKVEKEFEERVKEGVKLFQGKQNSQNVPLRFVSTGE